MDLCVSCCGTEPQHSLARTVIPSSLPKHPLTEHEQPHPSHHEHFLNYSFPLPNLFTFALFIFLEIIWLCFIECFLNLNTHLRVSWEWHKKWFWSFGIICEDYKTEGICWERTDRGERLEVNIQIILTHKQTAGRAMRERKTCRMNEKHTINRSVKSIMTNLKLI